MRIGEWIERLNERRWRGAKLEARGAADYASAKGARQRSCAYVLYADESASPNAAMVDAPGSDVAPVRQTTTVGVTVLLAVTNRRPAGSEGVDELEKAREAVREALLGWQPPSADGAVSYRSGSLLAFEDDTLWWADEYEVPGYIESELGGG